MTEPSDGLSADVAGTLEDYVDDALAHATDGTTQFHLRHAQQLLVDLEADASEDADGEEARGDAD